MAINRSRESHWNQKNGMSVFAAEHVNYSYLIADSGSGSILGVLPPHSILIHIAIVEEEATDSAAKFDMTIGGIAVLTNAPLDANALFNAPVIENVHLENGGDIIVKQGTSAPTQGEFTFVIMYVEHKLHNGEYTNFSDT